MRKNFRKIFFFLPIIGYIVLFLLYEPYNYYGIRQSNGDLGSPVTMIRKIKENRWAENILLGASRTATLYPDYLYSKGVIEEKWLNLSMTGASVSEMHNLLMESVQNNSVHKVVLTTGFYAMNLNGVNRFKDSETEKLLSLDEAEYFFSNTTQRRVAEKMLKEPLVQAIYNSQIDDKLGFSIPLIDDAATEAYWEAKYDDYISRVWEPYMDYFFPQADCLAEIIEMDQYCKDNGISFSVVTMPLYRACFDCMKSKECISISGFYKDFLSLYMNVYDMEYEKSTWTDKWGYFYDGLHYNGINFTDGENMVVADIYKTLFSQNGQEMQVLSQETCFSTLFDLKNVSFTETGEQKWFSEPVEVEENGVYIVRCKGLLPQDTGTLFCGLFDAEGERCGETNFNAPVRIGDTNEYFLFFRTKRINDPECQFRMVYTGQEEIHIDEIELLRYDWESRE